VGKLEDETVSSTVLPLCSVGTGMGQGVLRLASFPSVTWLSSVT
jgi:hypothetical protein